MSKEKLISSSTLSLGLGLENAEGLDRIETREYSLKKGEYLFFEGDLFQNIYLVNLGSIKTYTISNDGDEHIASFYLPGEVLGWVGIGLGCYPVTAQVIEASRVIAVSFKNLEEVFLEYPKIRQHLMGMMSKKMKADQQIVMLISNQNAEQRIAAFLMNIACRMHRQGFSCLQFRLPISRGDIGNYLGLSIETVSRIFSRLQRQGLFQTTGKAVKVLEPEKLSSLSATRISDDFKALLRE